MPIIRIRALPVKIWVSLLGLIVGGGAPLAGVVTQRGWRGHCFPRRKGRRRGWLTGNDNTGGRVGGCWLCSGSPLGPGALELGRTVFWVRRLDGPGYDGFWLAKWPLWAESGGALCSGVRDPQRGWLDANLPGREAGEADAFYGYYTLHSLRGSNPRFFQRFLIVQAGKVVGLGIFLVMHPP